MVPVILEKKLVISSKNKICRIILSPKSENIDSKIAYFYLKSVFFDSKSASFDLNVVFLLIKDVIFYSKSVFFIQKV